MERQDIKTIEINLKGVVAVKLDGVAFRVPQTWGADEVTKYLQQHPTLVMEVFNYHSSGGMDDLDLVEVLPATISADMWGSDFCRWLEAGFETQGDKYGS